MVIKVVILNNLFYICRVIIKIKNIYNIMKIVLRVLLLAAIVLLTYMCVQSIRNVTVFQRLHKERQATIVERLIEIRNAQIGFRSYGGTNAFAGSFDELKQFLNDGRIPFIIKEGELTEEQLKSGMTDQEAVKKGLIRRDTTWVIAKDTLLSKNYNVSKISQVPGFENVEFTLDTATLVSSSGYIVPVFEAAVPFEVFLGDLDRQELVNLKDKQIKMGRYPGLKVGSVTDIINNAGNWE